MLRQMKDDSIQQDNYEPHVPKSQRTTKRAARGRRRKQPEVVVSDEEEEEEEEEGEEEEVHHEEAAHTTVAAAASEDSKTVTGSSFLDQEVLFNGLFVICNVFHGMPRCTKHMQIHTQHTAPPSQDSDSCVSYSAAQQSIPSHHVSPIPHSASSSGGVSADHTADGTADSEGGDTGGGGSAVSSSVASSDVGSDEEEDDDDDDSLGLEAGLNSEDDHEYEANMEEDEESE